MTRDNALAWAAGLFEGEGCFSVGHGNPFAQLAMTDRDIVERFHSIMGVGKIYTQTNRTPAGNLGKTTYIWRAQNIPAFIHVAELLAPFLGERRHARLMEVWAMIKPPGQRKDRSW